MRGVHTRMEGAGLLRWDGPLDGLHGGSRRRSLVGTARETYLRILGDIGVGVHKCVGSRAGLE